MFFPQSARKSSARTPVLGVGSHTSTREAGTLQNSLRRARPSVLKHLRCCDDDREAVGDDGVLAGVVVRSVRLDHAGDGVGQAVAEVDAGVAEAHAGKGGGQVHVGAGLHVVGVVDGALKVLGQGLEGVTRPDVGDGIVALVGGTQDGVRGARAALGVVQGGVRLQCVAQNIKTKKINALLTMSQTFTK